MAVYNIPIHGVIGSPEEGETGKYFQYTDLLLHINNSKLFDTINLDIDSVGGYTDIADRMIEAIKATGKFITSCNSGNVCSAASKIFTIAPKGSRFFHPEKGEFLIHNPWVSIDGDANELVAASKELKAIENEYAAWYSAATGADEEIIKAFMAENIPLTPEQVESLGFATLITQPVLKAVAKIKSKNNEMDNKEVKEKLNKFDSILNRIMSFLKIKALMLTDANGNELEFPDIADISELAVGLKALLGGAAANGEYTMPDGSVVVCENGIVTEINPPAMPDPGMAELTAQNEALKAELETLKAANISAEAKVQEATKAVLEIKAEYNKFKNQFSKFTVKASVPGEDNYNNNVSRKPFKSK
jgi:ATP-dependent Clp protease, protease subunit